MLILLIFLEKRQFCELKTKKVVRIFAWKIIDFSGKSEISLGWNRYFLRPDSRPPRLRTKLTPLHACAREFPGTKPILLIFQGGGQNMILCPRAPNTLVRLCNYDIQLSIINVSKLLPYACNFVSIGSDFTRWGIDGDRNRVSPRYASSGDTLFRDTGTCDEVSHENRPIIRMALEKSGSARRRYKVRPTMTPQKTIPIIISEFLHVEK